MIQPFLWKINNSSQWGGGGVELGKIHDKSEVKKQARNT